jgi:hypothetical protein
LQLKVQTWWEECRRVRISTLTGHIEIAFDIARRFDGVSDVHVDETGDFQFAYLRSHAETTIANGRHQQPAIHSARMQ